MKQKVTLGAVHIFPIATTASPSQSRILKLIVFRVFTGGAANTVKLDGEGARVEGEGSGHGHGHGHENEQGHEHGLKGLAEKGKELLTGKKH